MTTRKPKAAPKQKDFAADLRGLATTKKGRAFAERLLAATPLRAAKRSTLEEGE